MVLNSADINSTFSLRRLYCLCGTFSHNSVLIVKYKVCKQELLLSMPVKLRQMLDLFADCMFSLELRGQYDIALTNLATKQKKATLRCRHPVYIQIERAPDTPRLEGLTKNEYLPLSNSLTVPNLSFPRPPLSVSLPLLFLSSSFSFPLFLLPSLLSLPLFLPPPLSLTLSSRKYFVRFSLQVKLGHSFYSEYTPAQEQGENLPFAKSMCQRGKAEARNSLARS